MVDVTKAPPATTPVALSEMKVPDIARAINDKVAQMAASVRTSHARAIEIGELLLEAKRRVGHGKFEKWRGDYCQLSPATARRCMEFAEKRPELEKQLAAKSLNLSDLNLTSARKLLAPPRAATEKSEKSEPKPTDHYDKIEGALIEALKDLDLPDAKGCADRTIGALNDTVEDIEGRANDRPLVGLVPADQDFSLLEFVALATKLGTTLVRLRSTVGAVVSNHTHPP